MRREWNDLVTVNVQFGTMNIGGLTDPNTHSPPFKKSVRIVPEM